MTHTCRSSVTSTTGGTVQVILVLLREMRAHSFPPTVSKCFFWAASVCADDAAHAPVDALFCRQAPPSPK